MLDWMDVCPYSMPGQRNEGQAGLKRCADDHGLSQAEDKAERGDLQRRMPGWKALVDSRGP
jgi:hypothetical protein